MAKLDQRIKVILKRGTDSRALVDLFREGNDYHATLSGSDSKHTYHASGRRHITSIKYGVKEHSNITHIKPPSQMTGYFQLLDLSITPLEAWHSDQKYFKSYHGKKVSLLEAIDATSLTENDSITILVGLAESRAHMNRQAARHGKMINAKPVVKRYLDRPDGPGMTLIIFIKQQSQTGIAQFALSMMGDTLSMLAPTPILKVRPNRTSGLPGQLIFPTDKSLETQYCTVWFDENTITHGTVFNMSVQLQRVPTKAHSMAVLLIIPPQQKHLVTERDIYLHLMSDRHIPLPFGTLVVIDTAFAPYRKQQFSLLGQWYQVYVKGTPMRRKAPLPAQRSDTNPQDIYAGFRFYFILEFKRIHLHMNEPQVNAAIAHILIKRRKLLQPVQCYLD